MTRKLFEVLSKRHTERDPSKPWVFWHSYWSNKTGERLEGPYKSRRKALKTLCTRAGSDVLRFPPIPSSGGVSHGEQQCPRRSYSKGPGP